MRLPDDNLKRFVRRVRWRLILARALERMGLGVAVASVFACVFAAVALVQGRDAMPLVLPVLAGGAVIGLLWGLARRTSAFDAAVEADAQLRLSDLLATAWAARQRQGEDEWQLAVVAIANDRCRNLSPSDVVVRRFGGRAWGGIGLATALGLTLGLLTTVPRETRARVASETSEAVVANGATDEPVTTRTNKPDVARLPADAPEARSREDELTESTAGADAAKSSIGDASGRPGNDAGDGSRPSETPGSDGDATPRPAGGQPPRGDADGVAGGGGPSESGGGSPGPPGGGGTGRENRDSPRIPSWHSESWEAARGAAGAAVRDGKVPDAYRDVVGEYFRAEPRP